ncbi:MAG: hypothetical protein AB2L14_22270 [Candidatus Xenobiia bacterium LiM19]
MNAVKDNCGCLCAQSVLCFLTASSIAPELLSALGTGNIEAAFGSCLGFVISGIFLFPGILIWLTIAMMSVIKFIFNLFGIGGSSSQGAPASAQTRPQSLQPPAVSHQGQASSPVERPQTYRPADQNTATSSGVGQSDSVAAPQRNRQSESLPTQKPEPGFTYRPRGAGVSGFSMRDLSAGNTVAVKEVNLKDIQDAFTGSLLDTTKDIYQCKQCKVYYQSLSIQVLREENGNCCVSCSSKEIVPVKSFFTVTRGINIVPAVVTLKSFREHIGRTITFEGYVPRVNVSRDGRSYAVMFEDTSWNYGLKMTVFKGTVRDSGGSRFLKSLQGKTIKIRGLLTNHHTFGYQIVVSHRDMILEIR